MPSCFEIPAYVTGPWSHRNQLNNQKLKKNIAREGTPGNRKMQDLISTGLK